MMAGDLAQDLNSHRHSQRLARTSNDNLLQSITAL